MGSGVHQPSGSAQSDQHLAQAEDTGVLRQWTSGKARLVGRKSCPAEKDNNEERKCSTGRTYPVMSRIHIQRRHSDPLREKCAFLGMKNKLGKVHAVERNRPDACLD